MSKKHAKKEFLAVDTPKDLLVTLLMVGGGVAAVAITPAIVAPVIAVKVLQDNMGSKKKFVKAAHYAKREKLIYYSKKHGELRLTKKGVARAKKHLLLQVDKVRKKKKQKKWDGIWRLLIFDIEHDKRSVRNTLRSAVKRIGMIQLQKSVWVYPFDISEELRYLEHTLLISEENVRIILAKDIGSDKKLKKHFKI